MARECPNIQSGMSETAPVIETVEMDGEMNKEDEAAVIPIPNSPGEKGSRAKDGQPETPTTGGRVQSRRGLVLAAKVLDAETPAGAQAYVMYNFFISSKDPPPEGSSEQATAGSGVARLLKESRVFLYPAPHY